MNATFESTRPRTEKFIDLVGDLQTDIKTLISKELELAKAETSEKVSKMGRDAAFGAAGGALALMSVFLLLMGIGAIIARIFISAGLSPGAAYFLSFVGLALVLGAVGYALIMKAVHAFKKVSLAPEKAMNSMRVAEPVPIEIKKKISEANRNHTPKPSSHELQEQVFATRMRMDNEMSELKERLTPKYMAKSFVGGMKHHPVRALLLSAASTGIGSYLFWRRHQRIQIENGRSARRWLNFKLHHV